MKVVRLEISDIETWVIPLEFIAKHRADYYKSKSEKDFNYDDEIKFIMNDDYEGIDWLQNNMDYDDFVNVLKVIRGTNLQDIDWVNSDSEIMDLQDYENGDEK